MLRQAKFSEKNALTYFQNVQLRQSDQWSLTYVLRKSSVKRFSRPERENIAMGCTRHNREAWLFYRLLYIAVRPSVICIVVCETFDRLFRSNTRITGLFKA